MEIHQIGPSALPENPCRLRKLFRWMIPGFTVTFIAIYFVVAMYFYHIE
jgi:hypothetical protein